MKMIITAIGKDKIGIVAELTNIILNFGGNIRDSKMTRLENYFTMMISISISNTKQKNLVSELKKLNLIQISTINTDDKNNIQKNIYKIKLIGENREGYVFILTRFLKKNNINIETLDTQIINAPTTGTKYFLLNAKVNINKKIDFKRIKKGLLSLSDQNNIDINIKKNNED